MAWILHSQMTREVAQTLQETRKMARSIENAAGSLAPLTDGDEQVRLAQVESKAVEISAMLTELYNGIARRAFGPDSVGK